MPPPGGHHHARSLPPNGPSDPLAGAGDRARVLIAPGLEPVTRGAQREGSGRRPVARPYRSGGAIHPFEGALSPDRVPASANALELTGFESAEFEPAAGAAGSLREEHRARRCQVCCNRLRWCGHTARRDRTRCSCRVAASALNPSVRGLRTADRASLILHECGAFPPRVAPLGHARNACTRSSIGAICSCAPGRARRSWRSGTDRIRTSEPGRHSSPTRASEGSSTSRRTERSSRP